MYQNLKLNLATTTSTQTPTASSSIDHQLTSNLILCSKNNNDTLNLNTYSGDLNTLKINHYTNKKKKKKKKCLLILTFSFFFTLIAFIVFVAFNLYLEPSRSAHDVIYSDTYFLNKSLQNYCGRTLVSSLSGKKTRKIRIINGDESVRSSWPWMVSFRYVVNGDVSRIHYCAGSIITNEHILTTAHCFRNLPANKAAVVITESLDEVLTKSNTFNIQTVIRHGSFRKGFSNDIAIVKLSRKIQFNSNVLPICLPSLSHASYISIVGKNVSITGW